MNKYALFLKWWLFFTLTVVGTIFAQQLGVFLEIWEKDASYLSIATMAIFTVATILCGSLSYKVCRAASELEDDEILDDESLGKFEREEELGWFFSELCLTLGMVGTIIGFVMMLSGFESLDLANPQTVQGLLSELGKSMATALYTTLVGLICGTLLKVQYFAVSLDLQRLGEKN